MRRKTHLKLTTEKDYVKIQNEEFNKDIEFINIDLIIQNENKLIEFYKFKKNENEKYFLQFLFIIFLFLFLKL